MAGIAAALDSESLFESLETTEVTATPESRGSTVKVTVVE